jgi:hypothetical protein
VATIPVMTCISQYPARVRAPRHVTPSRTFPRDELARLSDQVNQVNLQPLITVHTRSTMRTGHTVALVALGAAGVGLVNADVARPTFKVSEG